jgi:hypothetical protein
MMRWLDAKVLVIRILEDTPPEDLSSRKGWKGGALLWDPKARTVLTIEHNHLDFVRFQRDR